MEEKIMRFDQLCSIKALVESYPAKLKEFTEDLISCNDDGNPMQSDSHVLKTIFLYFFELMGVTKEADLRIIIAKALAVKKEQDWDKFFKEADPEKMINFDQL